MISDPFGGEGLRSQHVDLGRQAGWCRCCVGNSRVERYTRGLPDRAHCRGTKAIARMLADRADKLHCVSGGVSIISTNKLSDAQKALPLLTSLFLIRR